MEYLFIESPTGGGGGTGGGHTVYTRTGAIMLQQHQSFPLSVISDCLPHPSPAQPSPGPPVAPGAPAPADKEGKRETGRTPEGNRCQRYPGFAYREERGGGGDRVQGKGNQYIAGFYCFDLITVCRLFNRVT